MGNIHDRRLNRREFLVRAGLGGLALGAATCGGDATPEPLPRPTRGAPAPPPVKSSPVPPQPAGVFPLVEARGTPFEIGSAVGSMTGELIEKGIAARRAWFDGLKAFALEKRAERLDGFAAAIEQHHPEVLAEIKGLAAGSGRPLDDILVLNLQCELAALREQTGACDACSTLHLVHDGRALLAHNEDGDDAYRELMTVQRLHPEGKPALVALAYPGLVVGSVPAMSSAGHVQTTNFIGAAEVRTGVPRYVLGRAALGASSLDEARKILSNEQAAYSFHANIGSLTERRLLAVDVAVGRTAVRETKAEIFLQTNHFALPETRDIPQPGNVPGGSSDSRYRVLEKALGGVGPIDQVTGERLVELLSSHESVTPPYSPCRHPDDTSSGRTLGTALFDLASGSFTLYEGNPCEGKKRTLAVG